MNKKGFTIIELITSFTLTSIVASLLFEVIFILKDLYTDSGIKAKLLTKQALISEKINDELMNKNLVLVYKCGLDCIVFSFEDGSSTELSFNRNNNTLKYGSYKTQLIDGSQYGNINISTEKIVGIASEKKDSIVKINIPIFHKLFKQEDYGVNIAYQYNSRTTSIAGLYVSDVLDIEKRVYLVGSNNDISFTNIAYTDPGYFVVDSSGNILENDTSVNVSGTVGNEAGTTYTLTYTILDSNENVMDEVKRKITVIDSKTIFNYTGEIQNFKAPISGLYKIEAWGAQGGTVGTYAVGGKGGYTTGQLNLAKNSILNIYVGGKGNHEKTVSVSGGFNGGGNSGYGSDTSGGSGGGASDVRQNGTALSNRIIVAGGGGGAGSRNQASETSHGGSGGGLQGNIGSHSTISYNGQPGTSASGGSAATYSTGVTILQTAGSLGLGGNGGSYSNTYGGGGGGAGYYGGGGGVRYGTGAGGSGYCGSLLNCESLDGNQSFISVDGVSSETGHEGDGFIKITLMSITS